MRWRWIATLGSILALALAVTAAAAKAPIDSYCSPTGDYCTGVFREGGRIKLRIDTFSFRGHYRLCVRSPRGRRKCRAFRLGRKQSGLYGSRIDFARRFPHRARGRYAVSWHYGDFQIGDVLHFSKPG